MILRGLEDVKLNNHYLKCGHLVETMNRVISLSPLMKCVAMFILQHILYHPLWLTSAIDMMMFSTSFRTCLT